MLHRVQVDLGHGGRRQRLVGQHSKLPVTGVQREHLTPARRASCTRSSRAAPGSDGATARWVSPRRAADTRPSPTARCAGSEAVMPDERGREFRRTGPGRLVDQVGREVPRLVLGRTDEQ
ncbi:hypothetical protein IHE70_33090 [Streptomyces sp. ID-01-6.2a]|uniref:Uncharacterized protein n=1 Tax=Streptomyces caniscabiei TaxID=2746961 RepID=A0A927QIY0_9ACTN|nr:hypothetical protein [Streptomyces caniscabiei]